MKRQQKKYARPLKPWSKARIERDSDTAANYGLRRKKEVWKAESILRGFRALARELAANRNKERETVLLERMHRLGLVQKTATLDDVLALKIENILDRRLQSIVTRKGLATTQRQARQYIVHGHIAVNGSRVKWPSTLVTIEDEPKITLYGTSKLKDAFNKPPAIKEVKGEADAGKTTEA